MSLQDSLFSEEVERDIKEFAVKEERRRVLVFPPVNNYRRFLIHQFVQTQFEKIFTTFSIGQGAQRRTVVCYKTDVIRDPKLNGAFPEATCRDKIPDSACVMGVEGHNSPLVSPENSRQRQVKSVPSVGIYRPPPARKARCDNQIVDSQQDQQVSDSSQSSKANRLKRPDRAVYVPRHRRSTEIERSPLPEENPRPKRSNRERRSATTSPAHTSSSSTDNGGAVLDSCSSTDGREQEIDVADASGVLETGKDANSLFDKDPTHSDAPLGEERVSKSKKEIDEKLGSLEDPVSAVNGVEELRESETVQRKQLSGEFHQRHETGLILDSCEGGADGSENNQDGEKPGSVERKDSISAAIETNETMSEVFESETMFSRDKSSGGDSQDLIMSQESNKKEERTKEELLNRDEVVNHKNRRIVRQNLVSDVLLISDEVPRKREIPVIETSAARVSPDRTKTKEKKVKKIERPKSKPAPPPLPPTKFNRDECDWDSLFDDNGDCLDPTLIEELTTAVGEVTIEQPKSDYRAFTKAPVEVSNDEFGHVIEIYNFPSDFKTSDLAAVFSPFKNGGFELKWVDDTHCLGVFSSPLVAAEVLSSDHSFVKTRPLSEATALSKTKARRSAEFLQPYRARPETCAALARRLVTGALGVRLATARQEREREKIVLREAKERRRLANKQREDAWEGIIAEK